MNKKNKMKISKIYIFKTIKENSNSQMIETKKKATKFNKSIIEIYKINKVSIKIIKR